MAVTLPPVPPAPATNVQRFTPDGRPTPAQVTYETRMKQFLDAVKKALEGT